MQLVKQKNWQHIFVGLVCIFFSISTWAYTLSENNRDELGEFLQEYSEEMGQDYDAIADFLSQHQDEVDATYPHTPSIVKGPLLAAQSALIMDADSGEILFQKNSHQIRPIASISKLVSAMVVLDAKQKLNEKITITKADIDRLKGSSSRLTVGTRLTRQELLHLGLMSSENRAIHALARTYPGGVSAFVSAMNRKVRSLEMMQSKFYEPTGLDPRNVSTAHDLSLLVKAANQYPLIRQFSTDNYGEIMTSRGRKQVFHNSNALVREGVWNVMLQKTGYIREAGRSMVIQVAVRNRPLVIILLNAPTSAARVNDVRNLHDWAMGHIQSF